MLFLLLSNLTKAQDFHFSQINETPLLINPALTGAFEGNLRAHIYFRNQWAKVINPYETFGASIDGKLSLTGGTKKGRGSYDNGFLSFGFSIMKDKTGKSELATTQALFSVAYHQRIQKYSFLTAGLQGGFTQKNINYTNLFWDNQYDPLQAGFNQALSSKESQLIDGFSYNDISAGVLYSFVSEEGPTDAFDKINLRTGVSYYYFTKSDKSFTVLYNNPMHQKIIFHGVADMGIYNSGFALVPIFMYEIQGPHRECVIGNGFKYEFKKIKNLIGYSDNTSLTIGYLVRTGDSFIPYMAIAFSGFNLGISYDANFSDLKNATKRLGGFEINLRFTNEGK